MPKYLIAGTYTTDGATGVLREGGTGRRAAAAAALARASPPAAPPQRPTPSPAPRPAHGAAAPLDYVGDGGDQPIPNTNGGQDPV